MRSLIRSAAFLGCFLASLPASRGEEEGKETEWGEPHDGLVCRVIIKSKVGMGEDIPLIVEIKNISDRERLLLALYDFQCPRIARLTIRNPSGKTLRISRGSGYGPTFGSRSFKPLAPGEVRRFAFPDIRFSYHQAFANPVPGTYTLTYTYFGAKPEKTQCGSRSDGQGRRVPLWDTPTPEQVKKAWQGELMSQSATFEFLSSKSTGLIVHEWGVFTVYNDLEYANAGRKAEWASLPGFFYRQFPKQRLRWLPAAWDKPIIYFHTQRNMALKVEVGFPKGAPVVWWPAAVSPADNRTDRDRQPVRRRSPFRKLTWEVRLGDQFPLHGKRGTEEAFRKVGVFPMPEDCWLTKTRAVKEAALVSTFGTALGSGPPWELSRLETERFIYYDGLVPAPDFLRCLAAGNQKAVLKNAADFPLQDLFLVDRGAKDGTIGFASVQEIPPGKEIEVPLEKVPADAWPRRGVEALSTALQRTGLFLSEIDALIAVWQRGFFYAEGLTAIYRLPRRVYDEMLPLTVTPKPSQVIRVGLARHPHLEGEPARTERVRAFIAALDHDDFQKREAATRALVEMGPSAFRHLREAVKTAESLEVRNRCMLILDDLDASAFMKKAEPEGK
ncbi:MAG: hypothetical protein ACYTHM_13440 [Planctomycetota bacterium]|jgi:hypothetical protein